MPGIPSVYRTTYDNVKEASPVSQVPDMQWGSITGYEVKIYTGGGRLIIYGSNTGPWPIEFASVHTDGYVIKRFGVNAGEQKEPLVDNPTGDLDDDTFFFIARIQHPDGTWWPCNGGQGFSDANWQGDKVNLSWHGPIAGANQVAVLSINWVDA